MSQCRHVGFQTRKIGGIPHACDLCRRQMEERLRLAARSRLTPEEIARLDPGPASTPRRFSWET